MKAVGYQKSLPIDDPNSLLDIEIPTPKATGYDLLVEIKAIAVNPVDFKMRVYKQPEATDYQILGWDATGIVRSVGEKVSLFKPGDEVWYAGEFNRPGCNSEFHLVDERITGFKPKNVSFEQAASLPLTSLTAWELLFDRLQISASEQSSLLITGAAGGVGSILIQLARQMTSLTIIGTAFREQSKQWVIDHGAHFVIDHTKPFLDQLKSIELPEVDYGVSLTHTDDHAPEIISCLKPQGKFALIDDPLNLDIRLFKLKSISIHWELMFTRSLYKTIDMIRQHHILNEVAKLVEKNVIKTTLNEHLGAINAANLRSAHRLLESGQSRGKLILSGFN